MKLYVGNLSFDSNDADLRELFTPYGQPESVSVITDRASGKSKGFGFVEYANNGEGNSAITALNGKEFKGRVLTVSLARPRNESSGNRDRYRG